MCGSKECRHSDPRLPVRWIAVSLLAMFFASTVSVAAAQTANRENLSQQIQKLSEAIARTQAQLQQSQRQLDQMRRQLLDLQRQMAQSGTQTAASNAAHTISPAISPSSSSTSKSLAAAVRDIRDRQAVQEAEIATHEQTKVESVSKYPVKITGLLLFNAFVNSGAVDWAATPTVALQGSGSAGATVRQTILGLDAFGPRLFGAQSSADLRVDFDGNPSTGNSAASYSGYYSANATLLRLRTAHARLQWRHTEAFFSLDRPIFSPDSPTSLTAVAEPALAWSGNLWTWNPQVEVTQDIVSSGSRGVRLQAALVDVADAPLTSAVPPSGTPNTPPSSAEQSRWPGVEARFAFLGSPHVNGRNRFGVGGYFASHRTSLGRSFDAWAGTLDARLFLPARLQLTASFYRGLALGGLGGGAYKDFVYRADTDPNGFYLRPLDDVGGWAQMKEKFSERLEFNAAYGMDNVFAGELRPYAVPGGSMYLNLARNRTYTGNVIYSPSAYLLFSLEYRHLQSVSVIGPSAQSNIVGLGAGYKF